MTQIEYIQILRRNLRTLSPEEINEVVADVNEHFSIGLSEGKTEEEIANQLGSPVEMAIQYGGEEEIVSETVTEVPMDSKETIDFSVNKYSARKIIILIGLIFGAMVFVPMIFSVYAFIFSIALVGICGLLVALFSFISIFVKISFVMLPVVGTLSLILLSIGSLLLSVGILDGSLWLFHKANQLMSIGLKWIKGEFMYEMA